MSYNIDLPCGCVVYVSCHPVTGLAHTRVIQMRNASCSRRRHEVGARLFLWELLPDRHHRARPVWSDELSHDNLKGSLDGADLPPARSMRRWDRSCPIDGATATRPPHSATKRSPRSA